MQETVDVLLAAIAQQQAGNLETAAALCGSVLARDPEQPSALFLAGTVALGQGRPAVAAGFLDRAVTHRPAHAETRFAAATARHRLGDLAAAIAGYREVLVLAPGHPGARVNLANALREEGDLDAAQEVAAEACALHPRLGPAHAALAAALLAARLPEAALAAADAALALTPGLAGALLTRGTALSALGRPAEAATALRAAVTAEPRNARARLNLGNALADLDRMEEAEALCRSAIALEPDLAEAHTSLGYILTAQGRLDAAIAACRAAQRIDPRRGEAHWNESTALLLAGAFGPGFEKYEWRKRHESFGRFMTDLPGPVWEGEPLAGRSILVQAEQGLGDTIQMARYLPLLAGRGARVLLACDPKLIPLLGPAPGLAAAVPRGGALPQYDFWVDQMSLPRLFGTEVDTVPTPAGYLRPCPARLAAWRERLAPLPGPRVGLVWAGNPAHSNDFRRSLRPELLAPLLDTPGIRFVSLQVGRASPNILSHPAITDIAPALTDFAETAAAISNLDLVIAVDTSTAHLAGALGAPVWTMLPFAPDWRWLLARPDDTPWYASMRLFRQPRAGDWQAVIARVREALAPWRERHAAAPA
jgi:tetratricopeptide (TPR) repeat protein